MTSPRKIVLSFMAHPDDAEMKCTGTLIRLAELGWQVHIATATAGDAGGHGRTPWELAAIRTGENRKAAARIGATSHCLGLPDGYVVYDATSLRRAYDLFRLVNPGLVITHPAEDYHMDHQVTHQLARAAAFAYAAPNVSTYPLPVDAGVPYFYVCDPSGGLSPRGEPVLPEILIDVSAQMPERVAMLKCHASQREWLRAHHGVDEYTHSMRDHARARGRLIGCRYAEGFTQYRGAAMPKDDLLSALLRS